MNIETRAREIGYKIKDEQGIWIFEQGIEYIQSAFQAVRDEAIDDAANLMQKRTNFGCGGQEVYCSRAADIRLLKERKEP